jgi:hypothetical protein
MEKKGTKWIQKMHMKKGALHKKLEKASHSKNKVLVKRANLAKTLSGLRK